MRPRTASRVELRVETSLEQGGTLNPERGLWLGDDEDVEDDDDLEDDDDEDEDEEDDDEDEENWDDEDE